VTFASGGAFAKYSHEFQTISESGEDVVYVNHDKRIAINKEVYNEEVLADLGLNKKDLNSLRLIAKKKIEEEKKEEERLMKKKYWVE